MFFSLGKLVCCHEEGNTLKHGNVYDPINITTVMYYSHFKRVSSTYVDCGTASILASRFGSRIVMVNSVILNVLTRVKSLTLDSRDWTY